jgi:hypothetical protein
MNSSLRYAVVAALLGATVVVGVGATAAQNEAEVGRIVDMEPHHGYVVVQFTNGRMNVAMDKREMGQYIVGDEILIDSFGRPLPRRPPPSRVPPAQAGPPRPHR